jgi:GNAT superfamily N-acetyltransferase
MTRFGAPDPQWVEANSRQATLPDGTRVLIRPILPSDKDRLKAGIERMSPESRYLRFLHYFERLTPTELRYLTEIDYHDHFAWVALSLDDPDLPGLGVARYIRDKQEPKSAEAAVAVIDAFQRRGLGTLLLTRLVETARENGIENFVAYITPEHPAVSHLLSSVEATVANTDGLLKVVVPIGDVGPGADNLAILRAAASGQVTVAPPASPKWSTR